QSPLAPGEAGAVDCYSGEEDETVGGELRLLFFLNDRADLRVAEFGRVDGVLPGDRVLLENLENGERAWAWVDARGRFRTAVASDALGPIERRRILGLEDGHTRPVPCDDPTRLGDRLRLTVFEGESETIRAVVDSFGEDVTFQGTTYLAGQPLVALQEGLARPRNTPELRRFLSIAHHVLAQADPAVWAAHYFADPLDTSYDPYAPESRMHVLCMPTAGDQNVPVNTGIAMCRAAGLLGSWERDPERYPAEAGWRQIFAPDERYGTSIDQMLIDRYVVEADGRFQRYGDNPVNPNVIYDVDNVSDGEALFSCGFSDWSARSRESGCPEELYGEEVFFPVPHPEAGDELRLDRPRADGTHDAFRVPLLRPAGQHGIYNAQAFRLFDADAYMVSFTVRFLGSRGRLVEHEAGCDCVASEIPTFTVDGEPQTIALGDRPCGPDDLHVCSPECAEAWGIRTPQVAACDPP
ncbi:MAG: hypothetical protein ACOY3Y_07865, partial [Acidobacteriota bacterium]